MLPTRRHLGRSSLAAIVCSGVLVLAACQSSEPAAPEEEPTEAATAGEEADPGDDGGTDADLGTPVKPGTYSHERGPFKVTFTTKKRTFDPSSGADPYRGIGLEPSGFLFLDYPVEAADLSRTVTRDDATGEEDIIAGTIDFPADVGAWLEGATAVDIVDQGTLKLAKGKASWWDLKVSDPSARCSPIGPDEPCVVLWPYRQEDFERQAGVGALEWTTRIYVIDAGRDVLAVQGFPRGVPEEELSSWLATADQIVSSIRIG